ncbi:hypothetical protein MIB92_18335 [Aestuariirhabdus sp. Z084]|uniref:hypothetical protein n=1 Tax=Aestuariirhabdus haliotis TaxID=2918751 RepID=UPI00201B3AB8|nr:hypothetical protein [Aestuariirhabdus haliotis]MCL6417624.1 hypothetical protein [Aestuariirhabdus haliotis]MCL6421550.1 hypothetical protein [Aestuariirhabdus haliotis]
MIASVSLPLLAQTVVTLRPPESDSDKRSLYSNAVIKLALETTRPSHGDYHIEMSPKMNSGRSILAASTGNHTNFIFKASYNSQLESNNLIYIPFPVDLGIVGYRVCFTAKQNLNRIASIETLEQLKELTHGQGTKWGDVAILRSHGFNVTEIASYESLFKMVALQRFDLFCRGASELLAEYESHRHLENLAYDQTLSIVYPLPRFFYTNKHNHKAAKRILEGLQTAYKNGTLPALWSEYYGPSLEFVQLQKRRLFHLENPALKNLDLDYSRYFYNPLR